MKKFFRLACLLLCVIMAFGTVGCSVLEGELGSDNAGNTNDSSSNLEENGYSFQTVYAQAVSLGYKGTLEEFIESISGKDGINGIDGKDGAPGKDGKDGKDGVDGAPGKDGVSITEVFLNDKGHIIVKFSDGKETDVGAIDGVACVHQFGEWEEGIAPTCASIGYDIRLCSKCDYTEYDFKEALGHNKKVFYYDNSMHYYTCVTCESTFIGEHKLSDWSVINFATCTEDGLSKRECDCGYVEYDVLQAKGHSGAWIGSDATCTVDGHKVKVCGDCGHVDYAHFTATGHSIGSYVTYNDETHTFTCSSCKETITENHVFVGKYCACGAENPNYVNPNAQPVEINIQGYEAGVNLNWVRTLASEFSQIHANRSFVPGTRGVKFKIEGVSSTDTSSMLNNNIHFYVTHGNSGADTGATLAAQEKAVCIDDIVSEASDVRFDENGAPYAISIREKVMPRFYNQSLCATGSTSSNQTVSDWYRSKYNLPSNFTWGECYAMPSYGIHTGLSYDAYNFNCYGLWLADPAWAATAVKGKDYIEYNSKFGTALFVAGSGEGNLLEGAVKACGNDGLYCTWDDGQPTSMEELMILCDYMKNSFNIAPLSSYGKSHMKRDDMVNNLWASMGGYKTIQAGYYFDSKGETISVVTGFANTNAFNGVPYISKATTEEVVITPENAYLVNQNEARYYGISWLQIAYEEGWYSQISGDSNISHLDCEDKFILNGLNGNPTLGMLIEGNYWYNEARKNGSEDRFRSAARYDRPGVIEPDIRWMSLPSQVFGTVTPSTETDSEGNFIPKATGSYSSFYSSPAPIVINAKYKNDANLITLLKEFMAYCHTDEALSFYTGDQGVYRANMEYSVFPEDRNRLSSFQKSYLDAYELREGTVETVNWGVSAVQNLNYVTGYTSWASYESGARSTSTNAKAIFKNIWISADTWNSPSYKTIWQNIY